MKQGQWRGLLSVFVSQIVLTIVPLLLLSLFVKGVVSPVPPYCGYFVPSHFIPWERSEQGILLKSGTKKFLPPVQVCNLVPNRS